MNAEHLQVNRVENGWVVTVWYGGASYMLIAKTVEEVSGFIKGMEWTTPRPLYDQVAQQAPSGAGATYAAPR